MATSAQVTAFFQEMGKLCVAEANRRINANSPFVRPSVAMAQAALETGYGTSSLMTKANAYFGIKAGSSWPGKVYSASTKEVYSGVSVATTAVFRAYDTKAESVADYYDLIINNSRYADALSYYPSQIKSPHATIYAIWDGGYATDPDYVGKIMTIIEKYVLDEWDSLIDGETFEPSGLDYSYPASNLGNNIAIITGADKEWVPCELAEIQKLKAPALELELAEIKKVAI